MGIFVNKGLSEGEETPEKGGCQITSLPGIYYEKVNLKV